METFEKNYLGIDYGSSKIGVALAHAETRLALAYMTLKNDENLFDELQDILSKEEIGTVVIGVPHHDKREAGEYEAEKFGKRLSERSSIEVVYHDEMFTTKMAHAAMHTQGEKKVSTHDDAESARILLQSFLDKK